MQEIMVPDGGLGAGDNVPDGGLGAGDNVPDGGLGAGDTEDLVQGDNVPDGGLGARDNVPDGKTWCREIMFRTEDLVQEIMFRTEDLVQESKGKRALHPVQERHTRCDELSSYRSIFTYLHVYSLFILGSKFRRSIFVGSCQARN